MSGTILADVFVEEPTMQDKLDQLEAVVIDAFRSHREQQRRQEGLGLLPGEPITGETLKRDQLDEPLAA